MASIAELSQDLVNKLLLVPELATNNSVSVGLVDDPKSTQYQNIPIPFAGVRFVAEQNLNDSPLIKKQQPIRTVFAVSLHVKNGSDNVLNTESFPFLDKVRSTLEGTFTSDTAYAWQFVNGRMAFADETRLQYIQYYSVITPK